MGTSFFRSKVAQMRRENKKGSGEENGGPHREWDCTCLTPDEVMCSGNTLAPKGNAPQAQHDQAYKNDQGWLPGKMNAQRLRNAHLSL